MGCMMKILSRNLLKIANENNGLMIGIELNEPCTDLVAKALQQGLLINVAANKVIRLLPPLIINDDEAHLLVDKVSDLIIAH